MLFTSRVRLNNSLIHAAWQKLLPTCRRDELSKSFYMPSRLASWKNISNLFKTDTLFTIPNSVDYIYWQIYSLSSGCLFIPSGIL